MNNEVNESKLVSFGEALILCRAGKIAKWTGWDKDKFEKMHLAFNKANGKYEFYVTNGNVTSLYGPLMYPNFYIDRPKVLWEIL